MPAVRTQRTRSASNLTRPLANFGGVDVFETGRAVLRRAFDLGVTHFDLANNYGPPYGSAEENFGRWMAADFRPYRDELIISTKAGYDMWPGPYGDGGSRKYLLASLDQSLKRMGLDYVDIFYSHRVGANDSPRRDDGCARPRASAGQGAVRRHLVLFGRVDAPAQTSCRRGRAAFDPPAVLFVGEPLGRGVAARHA